MAKYKIHKLRVFTNSQEKFGNPLAIVIDEKHEINSKKRQQLVRELDLSEVVYIDNLAECKISIYSPRNRIPFAGHAIIGAVSFFKRQRLTGITIIRSMDHIIKVKAKGEVIWAESDLDVMPDWNFAKLESSTAVETITPSEASDYEHCVVWAWHNKKKSIVRARTFAPDWLIPEDEANGSGSMLLAKRLNRNLKILHGQGSVIYANYLGKNRGQVGGIVSYDGN